MNNDVRREMNQCDDRSQEHALQIFNGTNTIEGVPDSIDAWHAPSPWSSPLNHIMTPPQAHNLKRKRPQLVWLLAGPLTGGILTHLYHLSLLSHSYDIFQTQTAREFLYAAEVAPQLLRHRHHVLMEGSDDAWSDGIDHLPQQDNSDDNDRYERHVSPDNGECISMHTWQQHSYPNCNSIHELNFFDQYRPWGDIAHITHGGFNELYRYQERYVNTTTGMKQSQTLALKVLKYEKEYTPHKFGVVRQDSVTLERLTKSPYIYNIYGYCGFAMIVPFMTGGTLDDKLREWRYGEIEIDSRERLGYALDMARGLRDLHDIDGDGVPSATHGDLKEQQYLFGEGGRLLLGDFNKGQFLSKSSTTNKPCTYKPPSSTYNDKVFRSPEEYKNIQQTASTDIYALGSLFYYLITGQRVWEGMHDKRGQKQARKWIVEGKKPKIGEEIWKSTDPVDVALLKVYEMCTEYEPEKRASAKEVVDYLEGVWRQLE